MSGATQWEYKAFVFHKKGMGPAEFAVSVQDKLNELGREGWELTSTVPSNHFVRGVRELTAYLKREARG